MPLLRPLAALLAVTVLSLPVGAQDSVGVAGNSGATPRLPRLTLAVFAGGGDLHARNGTGRTVGEGSVFSVAVRWERTILRAGRFALAYRAELLPLVYGSAPRAADVYASCVNGVVVVGAPSSVVSACPVGPPAAALGLGIAPVGLTASVAIPGGLTVFGDANAGMLLFHRDFPINGSGHASTIMGYGLGVSLPVGASRAIVAGYRMQTFSNGFTAIENPALRTGVFQLGLGIGQDARGAVADDDTPVGRTTAAIWTTGVGFGAFDAVARRYSVTTQLLTVSARWERTIMRTARGTELRFAVDAIPLALAQTGPLPDFSVPACRVLSNVNVDPANCPGVGRSDDPAYGIGGSPFIIQYSLRGPGGTRLYAEGNAGGLLFSRDFPLSGSRHASFLLGAGGGIEIPLNQTRALVVGYKLQHLSNGYTASRNPGMNLHYLSIGVAVRH